MTEQRTGVDGAEQIKTVVDVDFAHAEKIVLVMDTLNTHAIASLYQAFPPEEAKRIRNRLEIHYTPKQGSWLNRAEIELRVINNHGLSDRIPTSEHMRAETDAWNVRRNKDACKIDWQFTSADARIKLKCLYPQFTS